MQNCKVTAILQTRTWGQRPSIVLYVIGPDSRVASLPFHWSLSTLGPSTVYCSTVYLHVHSRSHRTVSMLGRGQARRSSTPKIMRPSRSNDEYQRKQEIYVFSEIQSTNWESQWQGRAQSDNESEDSDTKIIIKGKEPHAERKQPAFSFNRAFKLVIQKDSHRVSDLGRASEMGGSNYAVI